MSTILLILSLFFGNPHPMDYTAPLCSTDAECEELYGPEPELPEARDA